MSATAQSKRLARPISRRPLTTGQRTAKEARQAHAARWRSELVREGSGARREHGLGVAVAPAGELVAVVVEHAVGWRRHDLAVAVEHAQVLGREPAPGDARVQLTSVVVTHDVTEVLTIADYIYILAEQKIIGSGTPEQIKNSDSPLVQQFLQGQADGPVPFHYPATSTSQAFLGSAS